MDPDLRIALLGASGFVGRHVAAALERQIVGDGIPPSSPHNVFVVRLPGLRVPGGEDVASAVEAFFETDTFAALVRSLEGCAAAG